LDSFVVFDHYWFELFVDGLLVVVEYVHLLVGVQHWGVVVLHD